MSDMELFWHNEEIDVPDLIRIAISHYQFETIHPFLDGNGRVGRLLITLYLVSKGFLHKPVLYLSAFFEQHSMAYYEGLMAVRTHNDLNHWLRFFLTAIEDTAIRSKTTFLAIMKLRKEVKHEIIILNTRSKNAKKLLLFLYEKPFITVKEVEQKLEVSHQVANALIKQLEKINILEEITGQERNRTYCFLRYFRLFEQDKYSEEETS